MTRLKRLRETSQLAKHIVDAPVGEPKQNLATNPVNEFARAGGLKGGSARADRLSPERRREIATAAAQARWGKD